MAGKGEPGPAVLLYMGMGVKEETGFGLLYSRVAFDIMKKLSGQASV